MSVPANPGTGDDRGGLAIDRLVSAAHRGIMPKLGAATATRAALTIAGYGGDAAIGLDAATSTLAGALTAAQFTRLAGLEVPLSRLNYAANTDVMNGVALVASTWTDVHANQSFTITSTTSLFLVELRLSVVFALPATDTQVASRLLFDSAGTPLAAEAGGGIGKLSTYAHAGGHFFLAQNFAAGTHTVKTQVFATTAATAFCRANTTPNVEWAKLIIFEMTP